MTTMPVLFAGHGSPMNAILDNTVTRTWRALGQALPRPTGIVMVSAHWQTRGTAVTAMRQPRTIHDFGGFPRKLSQVQYAAPGSPELAARVREVLIPIASVWLDDEWGIDHGAWSVLRHLYPAADVPVVQLSINQALKPAQHIALAALLAPLRDEGVLVMGSGNIVHNLKLMDWNQPGAQFDWALRFSQKVRDLIESGNVEALGDLKSFGEDGELAINSAEHFLPLLYVLALRRESDEASYPLQGIEYGSIDMTSVLLAQPGSMQP
jgi:4,5-DOPA dioxygenase extradiol